MSENIREIIDEAQDKFIELADAIRECSSESRPLSIAIGWSSSPFTKEEFANFFRSTSESLSNLKDDEVNEDFINYIERIPDVVDELISTVVPQLFTGNGIQAAPVLLTFLSATNGFLDRYRYSEIDWTKVEDRNFMPKHLARRLSSINIQIDALDEKAGDLNGKVKSINDAHSAAESLPVELESVKSASASSLASASKAELMAENVRDILESTRVSLEKINNLNKDAENIVKQCISAYSAVTSHSLGSSFDTRATSLAKSMWVWSAFLALALIVGGYISHSRISGLQALLDGDASSTRLIVSMLLAITSVAAPVWFAWIATKQIGQRFRLSEDYAFKASVAKAYEGYRRESLQLDGEFSSRLFSSTLDRLEELPLRYVENETHGSPWQEIFGRKRRFNSQNEQVHSPNSNSKPTDSEKLEDDTEIDTD